LAVCRSGAFELAESYSRKPGSALGARRQRLAGRCRGTPRRRRPGRRSAVPGTLD